MNMKLAEKIAEELKLGKGEEALQIFSSKLKELLIVDKTASWSNFSSRIEENDVETVPLHKLFHTQRVAWISC